jgi:hypothetical protein
MRFATLEFGPTETRLYLTVTPLPTPEESGTSYGQSSSPACEHRTRLAVRGFQVTNQPTMAPFRPNQTVPDATQLITL